MISISEDRHPALGRTEGAPGIPSGVLYCTPCTLSLNTSAARLSTFFPWAYSQPQRQREHGNEEVLKPLPDNGCPIPLVVPES